MENGNATIIVGSARQEHCAVFSACKSYSYNLLTNQLPETGRIMP